VIQLDSPRSHDRNISTDTLTKLRHIPLSKFLTYGPGKEAFRDFLVLEFSVENLLFVEAVLHLRERQVISKEEANRVFDEYVMNSAPNQVNLPGVLVQRLDARMKDGGEALDVGLFDDTVEHVMKLMQRDAYRRFQKTPEWQHHIAAFDDKEAQLQHPAIASVTATSTPNDRVSEGSSEATARGTNVSDVSNDAPNETHSRQTPSIDSPTIGAHHRQVSSIDGEEGRVSASSEK
jgi:hypothetical protein